MSRDTIQPSIDLVALQRQLAASLQSGQRALDERTKDATDETRLSESIINRIPRLVGDAKWAGSPKAFIMFVNGDDYHDGAPDSSTVCPPQKNWLYGHKAVAAVFQACIDLGLQPQFERVNPYMNGTEFSLVVYFNQLLT